MAEFVRVCSKGDLPPPGEAREVTAGARVVCIANVDGTVSAIDNVCLHRGGPIGQGLVEGGKVICPWHGWEWDPKTGCAGHNPDARVAVYPIKIEGEDVYIQF
jgi:nitrite reductase (NADH) small subunit